MRIQHLTLIRISERLSWINRHSASSLCLLFVFGIIAVAHSDAYIKTQIALGPSAYLDGRTVRQMRLIEFMHSNYGLAIAYVLLFLGFLWWLEFRRAPRWSVWATFCALMLPCIGYAKACLQIGNLLLE